MIKIFKLMTALLISAIIFFSCSQNYDYKGIFEIKNNSGFDVNVNAAYVYKTIDMNDNISTVDRTDNFVLSSGQSKEINIVWCFSQKAADFENQYDGINIKVVKKSEPLKILIEKKYELINNGKVSVWIETVE